MLIGRDDERRSDIVATERWAVDLTAGNPYLFGVRTVIELPTFQRQADEFRSEDERLDFLSWLATNPEAGDVIPGAEGARKVRLTMPGMGKRSGARVIYFNEAEDGEATTDTQSNNAKQQRTPMNQIFPTTAH